MPAIPFLVQVILIFLVLAMFFFALHAFTFQNERMEPESFSNVTDNILSNEELIPSCVTNENYSAEKATETEDDELVHKIDVEPITKMYKTNPYGYTITEPSEWEVPHIRQPPCLPKQQPIVMPIYTSGVPTDALEIVNKNK